MDVNRKAHRMLIVSIALLLVSGFHAAHAQNAPSPPKPHPEVQALLDLGDREIKANRLDAALKRYDDAREKARAASDRTGEALALNMSGVVYFKLGQAQKTLEFYQQALTISRAAGDKAREAAWLTNIGMVYASLGRPREALEYLEQALPIHRLTGNKPDEAKTLMNMGNEYASIGPPKKALEFYEQALAASRAAGAKGEEAHTLANMGNTYFRMGQPKKALEALQQALSRFRAGGDRAGEASARSTIGHVYLSTGEPKQALEYLELALPIHRLLGNKRLEATMLMDTGMAYSDTGQPDRALDCFQQALDLFRGVADQHGEAVALSNVAEIFRRTGQSQKALEDYRTAQALFHTLGDGSNEAGVLSNIGAVYNQTGRPQRALECYQRALAALQGLGTSGNRDFEATTLGSMGSVYAHTGQPLRALECHQKALALYHKLGNKRVEAGELHNIGNVYWDIGQPEQARAYFQQALDLHRGVGNRAWEANTLDSMGLAYHGSGQPQRALRYHRQALALYHLLGDKGSEARVLNNMGVVYYDNGQPQTALEYYRRALVIHRAAGHRESEAITLCNIGHIYAQTGRPQLALEYYRQALPTFRALENRQAEACVLNCMGIAYARTNDLRQADKVFQQAVSLLEEVRRNLGGLTEAKLSFLGGNVDAYPRCLDLLVRMGRPADAFALQQKMKARTLLDMLSTEKTDLLSRVTDEERARFAGLRARANDLNTRMVAEGVENDPGSKSRFAALQKELRTVEEELSRYTDTLLALHPDLARAGSIHTVTAAEAARLLPPDTALLAYSVLHTDAGADMLDRVLLFVVTPDGSVSAQTLKITTAQLGSLAGRFRTACADPRKAYASHARELYRVLIGPAAERLAGKKRLVICADGPLWDVPFAALMEGNRFLSDRCELAYGYSATGVQASLAAKADRRRRQPQRTAMVVADPAFGGGERFGDTPKLPGQRPIDAASRPIPVPSRSAGEIMAALYLPRGGRLSSLPGTRREAVAIQSDFRDTAAYLSEEAQEETVKREAGKYRYLHFATHGFFNAAAPLLSSIVLAKPKAGSSEDGFLTAREIFDMQLSADMVVLSACNTARGQKRGGEGIVGMSWALFVAGAPTQVLSQWAVDDTSTATLMVRFYAGIRGGEGKALALKEAEQSLRRDGKHRHPYYWAPFVLMGDWRQ